MCVCVIDNQTQSMAMNSDLIQQQQQINGRKGQNLRIFVTYHNIDFLQKSVQNAPHSILIQYLHIIGFVKNSEHK